MHPNRKNYRACRIVSQLTVTIGSECHEAQFNPTLYKPSSFILGIEIPKSTFNLLLTALCYLCNLPSVTLPKHLIKAAMIKGKNPTATNAMTFLRVSMEKVMEVSLYRIDIYPLSESRDQPNSQMRRNWSSIVVGEQSRFCRSSDPTSNSIAAANGQTNSVTARAATRRYYACFIPIAWYLNISEFLIDFPNY